jgi:hypothetical protein
MTSCARAWRKSGLVSRASAARAGALSVRSDLLSRPSRASALARAEREPGPSAKSREAQHRGRSVVRPLGPGSRCARPGHESGGLERALRSLVPAEQSERLRERSESRDPAQKAAKRNTGVDPSCGPWVPGLAALARDTRAGTSSVRSDLLSRPSRASALARAEREPGPSAKSREARHRGRSVVRPLGPGSRCARPGHASDARVSFGGVEQSALLVPAARWCARVGLYPFASTRSEGWAERRQAHISVVARARRDGPRW